MLVAAVAADLLGCGDAGGRHTGSGGGRGLLVIVEDRLALPLRESLAQFTRDLEAEGYRVAVNGSLAGGTPPARIRAVLRDAYRGDGTLAGAILVGEFSAPLHNQVDRQGDPYWHDQLADLYYMDLDGTWIDADGNGVFDEHRGMTSARLSRFAQRVGSRLNIPVPGDRRDPEIWVSRLRAGTLPSLGDEVTLLRDYFARNHAYRTGTLPLPPSRAFVASALVDVAKSDWGARPGWLYPDVQVAQCRSDVSASLRSYLASPEGFQLGVVNVFSGPRIHHFDLSEGGKLDDFWFGTAEGRWRIADYAEEVHRPSDVSAEDVAAMKPKVLFYHLITSETGRHDRQNYLGGTYLFSGLGLAVIAGTQHSGSIGVPVLYEELVAGRTLGDAWRHALAWTLRNSEDELAIVWCDRREPWKPGADAYRAVLLGDGTLRLPRRETAPAAKGE